MKSTPALVFAAASIALLAGIAAACKDGMKHPIASTVAIIAGLAPWLFWIGWHLQSNALTLTGMFGSAPLFAFAAVAHLVAKGGPGPKSVCVFIVAGLFAGILASVSLWGLLSQME